MSWDVVLSLVIPVYNTEAFLPRCLGSVTGDQISDIEILAINDGSTDNSSYILKEYAAQFPGLIKVIDKKNGGWGSVVNTAVEQAKGKYFKILDSDDWFDKNNFAVFIDALKDATEDLILSSFTKVLTGDVEAKFENATELLGKTHEIDTVVEKFNYKTFAPMANICYRTEVLKGLVFSPRYYTDLQYALFPLSRVKNVRFINIDIYRYYLGYEDHSTSMQGYIKNYKNYVDMVLGLVEFYNANKANLTTAMLKLYENEIVALVSFSYYMLMSPAYGLYGREGNAELKKVDRRLKTLSICLYRKVGKRKSKGIPYIKIWRATKINILNWRKWIL